MKASDTYVSTEYRFALGIDEATGARYVSIPVSNGVGDYEEFYALTLDEYTAYLAAPEAALPLVEACRTRTEDARLIQQPGWNRGTPV